MGFCFSHNEKDIVWIDKQDQLDNLTERLQSVCGYFAVDLEADSLHHYRDRVCLIQISLGDADYLVDPQSNVNRDHLWEVFESERIGKIFHDADFDLRSLNRDYGIVPRSIFDTKISAELLGKPRLGLSSILKEMFGIRLSKAFQRYRWSKRPIDREAMVYAALDTRYLSEIMNSFQNELEETGRLDWAREEFKHLETCRWEPSQKEKLGFWRIAGVKRMSPVQREYLRRVWVVREKEARKRDVPLFKIISDQGIQQLVQGINEDFNHLVASLRFKLSGTIRSRILRSREQALNTPESKCPVIPRELMKPSPGYSKRVYNLLKEHRDAIASRENLDPGLLIGSKSIKILAGLKRGDLNCNNDVKIRVNLRDWQWELLEMEKTLKSII